MNKKVLIIDDDDAILEAITIALESENYLVTGANGIEYLNSLTQENIPDIILTDMLLGGSNGKDVIEKIRSKEFTKQIPIIMVSAHPNAAHLSKQYGADGFLEKPFDVETLLSVIENVLKLRYE